MAADDPYLNFKGYGKQESDDHGDTLPSISNSRYDLPLVEEKPPMQILAGNHSDNDANCAIKSSSEE